MKICICSILILTLNCACIFGQNSAEKLNIKETFQAVEHFTTELVKNYATTLENAFGWKNKTVAWPSKLEDLLVSRGTYTVRGECIDQVILWAIHLIKQDTWALQMIDAFGKPSSGVLDGKLAWLGNWDQCRRINATVDSGTDTTSDKPIQIKGRYCSISYKLPLPPQTSSYGQTSDLFIGACMPYPCRMVDLKQIIKIVGAYVGADRSFFEQISVTCHDSEIPWDFEAIIALAICLEILLIMVVATVYEVCYSRRRTVHIPKVNVKDIVKIDLKENDPCEKISATTEMAASLIQRSPETRAKLHAKIAEDSSTDSILEETPKREQNVAIKLLLCFSVLTNGKAFLNTDQPKESISCVNGIRVLTMVWIIIGHSLAFGSFSLDNKLPFLIEKAKSLSFTPLINGSFSVDSFYVFGGIVLSIVTLDKMKKSKGARWFNWKRFYMHRLWRLLPTYTLFLMVYITLNKYWGDGPLWNPDGLEPDGCASWWTNLLFINNLYKPGNENYLSEVVRNDWYIGGYLQCAFFGFIVAITHYLLMTCFNTCFGWSWYISTDMQFFATSPLMLVPLFHFPYIGVVVCVMFLLLSAISSGIISLHYGLPPAFYLDVTTTTEFFWNYYKKPWCRVGPYAIGILTGYVLHKRTSKANLSMSTRMVAWSIAGILGGLILFGLHSDDFSNPFSVEVSALYNALARNIWAVCVAWMVFACATGTGGFINHLLSCPVFVPFARLTFCAYLVHPVVIKVHSKSMHTLQHLDNNTLMYTVLGHICITYALAAVMFLSIEAPFLGIEKCLFGEDNSSRKEIREIKNC